MTRFQDLLPGALIQQLSTGDLNGAAASIDLLERENRIESALAGRLTLGARSGDARMVESVLNHPQAHGLSRDPEFHALAAKAMYTTAGLPAAASHLRQACKALSASSPARPQLCALAELAELGERAPSNYVEQERNAQVPLLAKQPLPVVKATVNERSPEYFIFDTGAPTSLISKTYCDRHGLPYLGHLSWTASDGAGNEITLCPAVLDSIEVGGIRIRNSPVAVLEFPPTLNVAGILSPFDVFRDVTVNLDFRESRLRFLFGMAPRDWVNSAGETVYSARFLWDEGNPFVQAAVDGEKGWFLFDTGAGANFVTPAMAERVGRQVGADSRRQSAVAGGSAAVYQGFTGGFAVAGAPPVETDFMIKERVADANDPLPLICSGYVGVPWMKGRSLLLPPRKREVLFTLPG